MDAELRQDGHAFDELARRIREAPATLRKEINAGIRGATKPAETALKAAVLGLESAGKSGGGSRQRIEHARSRSRNGTVRGGQKHGLRAGIAKGITRKITYTGSRAGVRLRADAKYLPDSQKVLVKATNRGKIRHPAGWGANRGSVWVDQTFTPKGWFDETMKQEGPAIRNKIQEIAIKALEQLQ
jgi:hypothetical protein